MEGQQDLSVGDDRTVDARVRCVFGRDPNRNVVKVMSQR
jgi:hypothetical protein